MTTVWDTPQRGWSPLMGSVILSLSRGGSDSTGRLEVKGSVASRAKVLTQMATSASFGRGDWDDNSGWWWYHQISFMEIVNHSNHTLGLSQQNYRSLSGGQRGLLTHKLYIIELNLTLKAHWNSKHWFCWRKEINRKSWNRSISS